MLVVFLPLLLLYQAWTYYVFRKRVSARPQVLLSPAAMPRRLEQRCQERQPDRDRDEEEMVDRGECELNPR